jgi:protease PrsW
MAGRCVFETPAPPRAGSAHGPEPTAHGRPMLTSVLASILPTALWLWLFLRQDRHPEPAWLLLRTFLWGAFGWLVAAVLEGSSGHLPWLVAVLILTALTEEGVKLLAAATAVTEADFDEPMDGLIYAVTAALGFALTENLVYGFSYGPLVALWHGLVTSLAHALFSAPLGYALARARFRPGGGPVWSWWLLGLALSALLHLVFNSLLQPSPLPAQTVPSTLPTDGRALLALLALMLLMLALAARYYRELGEES